MRYCVSKLYRSRRQITKQTVPVVCRQYDPFCASVHHLPSAVMSVSSLVLCTVCTQQMNTKQLGRMLNHLVIGSCFSVQEVNHGSLVD